MPQIKREIPYLDIVEIEDLKNSDYGSHKKLNVFNT